jgi:hypothetical protein
VLSSIPTYSLKFGNCQPQSLYDLVREFVSPVGISDPAKSIQLNYLAHYVDDYLHCESYVCETHYIDRDYIDDFAGFYAKSLRQYPNYCWRVHFFAGQVGEDRLLSVLGEVKTPAENGKTPLLDDLRASYQGYVVLRPHPEAFVGKSVLAPPPLAGGRQLKCCRRYETHLAGISLGLDAIAFQQQDRTHSACATAALWAALQKSTYEDDLRVPSPREITESATRYFLSGRDVPNQGLSIPQICEAVRSSGLAPELYAIEDYPDLCRDLLQACLFSGVPVIAALFKNRNAGGDGHAVAVVGYEDADSPVVFAAGGFPPFDVSMLSVGIEPKGLCITKFYAHDDRIGPYARLTFKQGNASKIELKYDWQARPITEEWYVPYLIVPVYPKIRLDMRDVLVKVHPLVVALAQKYPASLPRGTSVQAMVMHGTSFSADLIRYARDAGRAYSVLSKRDFPRYIWVVRASKDGTPLLDFVCDPTDSRLGSFIFGLALYGERWQPYEAEILGTPELRAFPIWACV